MASLFSLARQKSWWPFFQLGWDGKREGKILLLFSPFHISLFSSLPPLPLLIPCCVLLFCLPFMPSKPPAVEALSSQPSITMESCSLPCGLSVAPGTLVTWLFLPSLGRSQCGPSLRVKEEKTKVETLLSAGAGREPKGDALVLSQVTQCPHIPFTGHGGRHLPRA